MFPGRCGRIPSGLGRGSCLAHALDVCHPAENAVIFDILDQTNTGICFFCPRKTVGNLGQPQFCWALFFLLDILMGIEPAKHWQTFCTTDVKCEARDFCPFFVQISEHRPPVKWIRIPHALHDPSVVSIRGFVLIQEVDSKASIHALAGHSTKRNGGMSMKEHGPKSLHHIASYWMVKD